MDILNCAGFIARSYPSAFFGRNKKVLKLGDLANVRAPVVESRFLVACLDSHCFGVKAPVAVGRANPTRLSTTCKVGVVKSNVTDIAAIAESMELHLAPDPVVAGMFTLLHTKACRSLANNDGNQQDFEQLGDHSWIRAVKRGIERRERERNKVLARVRRVKRKYAGFGTLTILFANKYNYLTYKCLAKSL